MNHPSTQDSDVLVDASAVLHQQAAGLRMVILDCRFELSDPSAGERAHATAHPRGAQYAHLDRDLSSPKVGDPRDARFTGRHPLPSRDVFAATMGRWGIEPGTAVVTFDHHGGPYASRAWWLLRWMGHERVRVLDGGLAAWLAVGGPMDDQPTPVKACAPYPQREPAMPVVSAAELHKGLGQLLVIDARGPDRFRGENETLDPVAGHIPGAVNRCFRDNLGAEGRFKPAAQLRQEWSALLAATPQAASASGGEARAVARVVQQCGSGVTACQNMVAMMHAGWPATALYPGSWSEWSADATRPVAVGS